MLIVLRIAVAATAVSLFAMPAAAHHSFSSVFDLNKKVTIQGVISKVQPVNPHGLVRVDVKDPQTGAITTWTFETHGPRVLRRQGLTQAVVGKHVIVEGWEARNGAKYAWASKYVFDDGHVIITYDPDGAPGAPER